MRSIKLVFLSALCLFSALSVSLPSTPAKTDGNASKLGTANLKKLRDSKMVALVPTYVPTGFKIDSLYIDKQKTLLESSFGYTYKNSKTGAEFTIQMASDGLGDPIFDTEEDYNWKQVKSTKAKSPVFGEYSVESLKTKKGMLIQATWYEVPGKQLPDYVMIVGSKIDPTTAVKVMNSLRFLK